MQKVVSQFAGGRLCVHISVETQHRLVLVRTSQTVFLANLVITIQTGLTSLNHIGTTLDEVKELFRSQTSECAMEPMDNGEFDLMIRFVDSEDPYYYCFKDEGCHIIYHRFLPEDYADFGF